MTRSCLRGAQTRSVLLDKIAVSDRRTLAGLTQFLPMPLFSPPQTAECKGDPVRADKIADVCDNLWQTARNLLILKRRDVRVVEGARLEIALAVCDGVLQISKPLRSQPFNGDRVYSIDRRKPR